NGQIRLKTRDSDTTLRVKALTAPSSPTSATTGPCFTRHSSVLPSLVLWIRRGALLASLRSSFSVVSSSCHDTRPAVTS
ncbi:MAG: hypothetical protein ACK56F_24335, partial [bacterium]